MRWKAQTIGKKIGIGFTLVLMLLGVIVGWGYIGVGNIVKNAQMVIEGNRLDAAMAQKEVDHLNWAGKVNTLLTNDEIHTLDVQTDDHKCAFGKWLYGPERTQAEKLIPSLAPLFKEIEVPHRALHQSAVQINEVYTYTDYRMIGFLREHKVNHINWLDQIKTLLLDPAGGSIEAKIDHRNCGLGRWLYGDETQTIKDSDPQFAKIHASILEPHEKLHARVAELYHYLENGGRSEAIDYINATVAPLAQKTLEALDQIIFYFEGRLEEMEDAEAIYAYETVPALEEIQTLLTAIRAEARKYNLTDEAMLASAQQTRTSISILGILAVVIGIALATLIVRGIVLRLKRVSHQVQEGAEQVSTAANQVSSSSQSQASGASQQASSLEETASALEEMATMTRQNACNASEADRLMQTANGTASRANQSMNALTQSMDRISQASQKTSNIMKTIDEIAFQTNLLALNAAVEAARAGEAGAGFAVVADEVRTLALRAAEAAKETAGLIEGTIEKVDDGCQLVSKTNKDFEEVIQSIGKIGELLSEIASACDQQARGVDQINTAVTEMDGVTQQNAASAEEGASASEELRSQALQLEVVVDEMLAMVGGKGRGKSKNSTQPNQHKAVAEIPLPRLTTANPDGK